MSKRNNLNNFAKRIAAAETGKRQVDIAQIKEIIKLISMELYLDLDEGDLAQKMINQGRRHVKKIKTL